jgi:hypothetical protein
VENHSQRNWNWWPLLPLFPYGKRQTIRREIVPGMVWSFEQLQGILHVITPIRMTIVKIDGGGLLVYAPIAPTPECRDLIGELEEVYGEVKYIILPTASGLEHKIYLGAFARKFPEAAVWIAPHQWSFPVNLPSSWLGLPLGRTRILSNNPDSRPFGEQFEYAILGPIDIGVGSFVEVALFDRVSQILLLTDTIVSIPPQPPEIVATQPFSLLFHARDRRDEVIFDSPINRQKGWQRISLFAFYFQPSALKITPWMETFQGIKTAPDRSRRNYLGLYPFSWQSHWQKSFEKLSQNSRPIVAPILQIPILERDRHQVKIWVEKVSKFPFKQIVPCHFDAPIPADSKLFCAAFDFLDKHDRNTDPDFSFVFQLTDRLIKFGVLPLDR